ncbi:MAG: glycerol kinase GlpK [Granulosicoccaceae bacterium]
MSQPLILSIDQGTTSSRAMLFETDGTAFAVCQQEFTQFFPSSAWVEHDPEEIWKTTIDTCQAVLAKAASANRTVAALGITNQRETTVIWNRKTGKAIHNAIVWQDRRTTEYCQSLKQAGHEATFTQATGLVLDPYFSGTKINWLLNNVPDARTQAENGELAFGTIDSFLMWRLTNGAVHKTDATNASRTLLYNIHKQQWDQSLLAILEIPDSLLPEVQECASDFGTTDKSILGTALPIAGVAGDQHAASIGQVCFSEGMVKSTYGTGCFVMLNTGEKALHSTNKMLTTIAYQLDGKTHYALEGSIFVAGAAVQWLRDGIGVIDSAEQTESLVTQLEDNQGVYMVPAFTGLGAPHWDPDARGAIFGLTRDTSPAHLVRAALESVCYQTNDLLEAMRNDGATLDTLRVDGGMVKNNWLNQYLSNVLDIPVQRPKQTETTALGAAYLAGLQTGVYSSIDDLTRQWQQEREFLPNMDAGTRNTAMVGWTNAVDRTRTV